MSDNFGTVKDSKKKTPMANVTNDSCGTEFTDIDRLDRTSDDYCRPEFIYPVVEVKPGDLQDVKEETDDDNTDVLHCLLKV